MLQKTRPWCKFKRFVRARSHTNRIVDLLSVRRATILCAVLSLSLFIWQPFGSVVFAHILWIVFDLA